MNRPESTAGIPRRRPPAGRTAGGEHFQVREPLVVAVDHHRRAAQAEAPERLLLGVKDSSPATGRAAPAPLLEELQLAGVVLRVGEHRAVEWEYSVKVPTSPERRTASNRTPRCRCQRAAMHKASWRWPWTSPTTATAGAGFRGTFSSMKAIHRLYVPRRPQLTPRSRKRRGPAMARASSPFSVEPRAGQLLPRP